MVKRTIPPWDIVEIHPFVDDELTPYETTSRPVEIFPESFREDLDGKRVRYGQNCWNRDEWREHSRRLNEAMEAAFDIEDETANPQHTEGK